MSVDAATADQLTRGIGSTGSRRRGDAVGAAAGGGGWLVSPVFDILFFVNIYWVLAFLPIYTGPNGETYVQFWMAYFLATPHRWLTLVIVVTDRDRRYGQTWLFVTIAVLVALVIGATLWTTGEFQTLFLFYTLLLGWHFAGQHRAILKVYSGRSARGIGWMEDWLPMIFILYTSIRQVVFLEPMLRLEWLSPLQLVDVAMLAIPAVMLGVELLRFSPQRLPKIIYMISFFGLWVSVLWAVHLRREALWSVLLGAVTIYHSVEYMAMVSYYASRRQELGSEGLFKVMARNWTVFFAWYVIGCGLLYSFGNAYFAVACFAINTWASILHCAYDGMMWRLKSPETARVFGIETAPAGEARSGS